MRRLDHSRGATLVELIMVIVMMGVISGACLVFMQRAFAGYEQSRERLAMAEQGRLALTRFKREARLALPNSARAATVAGYSYLEFAPVAAAGRYRAGSATGADAAPLCAADTALPDNSVLSVGALDSCLKPLASIDVGLARAGDWLVVFNAGAGYAGADFYETGPATGGNKSKLTAVSSSKLDFEPHSFAWDSPAHRFFIAQSPVSYVCDPVAKTLTRWSGYEPQSSQPTTGLSSMPGAQSGLVARNVSSCRIAYAPASVGGQFGLITLALEYQNAGGDKLLMQAQAQVGNMP
jgi:MSHA biogenesis protein MshO